LQNAGSRVHTNRAGLNLAADPRGLKAGEAQQDCITEASMNFYSLKTRSKVEVDISNVKKTKSVRETKNGEQVRYRLTASHNGETLNKFVGKDVYDSLDVEEV
jgi:hypothetical protein